MVGPTSIISRTQRMSISKSSSFKQLVTFHKVARLCSVSQAAKELFISQSAVSIQLANLEEATGTKLINRTGRGIRLTPAGEKLFEMSSRMIDLWQEISDEMDSYLGDFTGTLRIGAVTTAEFWLPHILVRFVNSYPKVQLKLKFANQEEIIRSLNTEEIDLAVTGSPADGRNFRSQSFAKNPTAFVAASQHPLTRMPLLDLSVLAGSKMLVREKGSGARDSLERVFKNAGLKLSVGAELSSNESIKQLCIAGLGPAYLSLHSCILEIRAGLLSVLPLENNPMNLLWNVVHLEHKALSQVASVFLGHLVQGGQAEIDEQMALMVKMPVRGIGKLYLGNSFVFSPLLDVPQGSSTELKDPSP